MIAIFKSLILTILIIPLIATKTLAKEENIIGGENRFETAIEISKNWKSSEEVVLVNSNATSDMLCATVLSSQINCPILLTYKDKIEKNTLKEIERLKAEKIYIIGGEDVINKSIEKELKENIYVERINGKDRYETSIKIADKINDLKKIDTTVIVNGQYSVSDAVSIAAVAGNKNMPIILSKKDELGAGKDWIYSNNIKNTYIIGGTDSISQSIDDILPNSQRIYGKDRYETNAKIIDKFYKQEKIDKIFYCKGNNDKGNNENEINSKEKNELIDGMLIAPLASNEKSPILLLGQKISNYQKEVLSKKYIGNLVQVGYGVNENAKNELYKIKEDYKPKPPEISPPINPDKPKPPETSPPIEPDNPKPPETSPPTKPDGPEPPETLPPIEPDNPEPPETLPPIEPDNPEPPETSPPTKPDNPEPPETSPPTEPDNPEHPETSPPTEPDNPEHPETSPPVEPDIPEEPPKDEDAPTYLGYTIDDNKKIITINFDENIDANIDNLKDNIKIGIDKKFIKSEINLNNDIEKNTVSEENSIGKYIDLNKYDKIKIEEKSLIIELEQELIGENSSIVIESNIIKDKNNNYIKKKLELKKIKGESKTIAFVKDETRLSKYIKDSTIDIIKLEQDITVMLGRVSSIGRNLIIDGSNKDHNFKIVGMPKLHCTISILENTDKDIKESYVTLKNLDLENISVETSFRDKIKLENMNIDMKKLNKPAIKLNHATVEGKNLNLSSDCTGVLIQSRTLYNKERSTFIINGDVYNTTTDEEKGYKPSIVVENLNNDIEDEKLNKIINGDEIDNIENMYNKDFHYKDEIKNYNVYYKNIL